MVFTDISLVHQARIRPFLDAWKLQLSEFSFVTMVLFQPGYEVRFAIEDDALFISMRGKDGRRFFLSPLPADPGRPFAPLIRRMQDCCREQGMTFWMRSCAKDIMERMRLEMPDLIFQAERNNFDYVYHTRDLIELAGKKYHAKRNHINKFNALYQFEYVPYETKYFDECMEVFNGWLQGKDSAMPGLADEAHVVETALRETEALGLTGGMIRVNGRIEAFSIGERIHGDMALIHVEKANAEIPGLYTLINQQFVTNAWADTRYVNREEDMGAEGLRKAKESYYPAFMVEKYDAVLPEARP